MEKQPQNFRIRRSIIALNKTQKGLLQRKRFFWCVKMLDVLPPFNKEHANWEYTSPAYFQDPRTGETVNAKNSKVHPRCLHDVLIASHQTSCQHRSLYFAYYHRHLMINYQIFLNFAHEIMKNDLQYLKQVYDPKDYPQLYKDQQKWNNIFKAYKKFNTLDDYIAAHYWNPCDYTNDEDLVIPFELKQKQDDLLDEVDLLCKVVRNSYAWSLNVATRWFQNENDPQNVFQNIYTGAPNGTNRNFSFRPTPNYSNSQQKLMRGQINPRNTNIDQYLKIWKSWAITSYQYARTKIYNKCKNSSNNFKNNENMTFQVNPRRDQQLKTGYFSGSNKQQYIEKAFQDKNPNPAIYEYNSNIPHFVFAESYIGKDGTGNNMKGYLYPGMRTPTIQRAHNIMHNNFRCIMNDPRYSVVSLIFYLYHSWIDLMLQFKIRQSNFMNDITLQLTFNQYIYIDGHFPISDGSSNLSQLFTENAQDNLPTKKLYNFLGQAVAKNSINGKIDLSKAGSYPIPQWVHPDILDITSPSQKEISVGFFASQFAVQSNNKLMDSRSINDVYKHFINWHENRFIKFKSIKNLNFNFNYEVYDPQGNYILEENGKLPSFIQIIIDKTIKPKNQYIVNLHQKLIKAKKIQIKPTEEMPVFGSTRPPKRFQRSASKIPKNESPPKISLNDMKKNTNSNNSLSNAKKTLNSDILLFIQYSPYLENGLYPIKLKSSYLLNNLIQKQINSVNENIKNLLKNGIFLTHISVFGKQKGTSKCYKCVKDKCQVVELNNDLRRATIDIWKMVHLSTLNKIIYDSSYQEKFKTNDFRKIIQIQPIQGIQASLVSGAEQIQIKTICSLKCSEPFLRINAELHSVSKGDVAMIATKKFETFEEKFDFYKVMDVKGNNSKINQFDTFVYKSLKIIVGVDTEFKQFVFNISKFQRFLRLNCTITRDETNNGTLKIVVQDSDYDLKKKYYESFQN